MPCALWVQRAGGLGCWLKRSPAVDAIPLVCRHGLACPALQPPQRAALPLLCASPKGVAQLEHAKPTANSLSAGMPSTCDDATGHALRP